jgi:hypothetical protein
MFEEQAFEFANFGHALPLERRQQGTTAHKAG